MAEAKSPLPRARAQPQATDPSPETSTKTDRALAVLGWVWIPIVWVLGMSAGPGVWGWAVTAWGGYGLYECTATLSDKREAWERNLKVARYAALAVVLAIFGYGIIQTA